MNAVAEVWDGLTKSNLASRRYITITEKARQPSSKWHMP